MPKRELPPFMWQVWFRRNKKPTEMSGFDEEHIKRMCEPKVPIKIKRITIKEKPLGRSEHLGPKGAVVNQPADYDKGFKILKEWVDSIGGPPENLRQKLRELFIDYHRPARKTTRYSARKKGRHKI